MSTIFSRLFSHSSQKAYNRGIQAFNDGNYPAAIREFEQVLESAEKGSPVYRLGRFYVTESQARLGHAHFEEGRLDDAHRVFVRVIKDNPNFPDIHLRLGQIAERRNQTLEATMRFRRALEIHPGYREASLHLGLLLRRTGRPEDAAAHFRTLADAGLEIPPDWLSGHAAGDDESMAEPLRRTLQGRTRGSDTYRSALARYHSGDRAGALEALRAAVDDNPKYPDLRCRLATALGEMGRFQEAIVELDRALAMNPRYAEARLKRAVAHLQVGTLSSAQADFESLLEDDPRNGEVQFLLGVTLVRQGRVAEAVRHLRGASNQGSVRNRAVYVLAQAYVALDRPDRAIDCLKDLRAPACEALLGRIHLQLGQVNEAIGKLEDALRHGPATGEGRLALGRAYLATGDLARARAQAESAIAMQGVSSHARLLLGQVAFAEGRDDEALEVARRLLGDESLPYDALVLMGRTLARLSRDQEAVAALRKALEVRPGGSEAQRMLGLVLRRDSAPVAAPDDLAAAMDDPCDPLWGSDFVPRAGARIAPSRAA
jgi:superkiller protein 3